MRMWMVPPNLMCRKHLLGEHLELHMLATAITTGKSIKGFLEDKLVSPHFIPQRHAQLVLEMEERLYRHSSPLDEATLYPHLQRYPHIVIDQVTNLRELYRRCEDCAAIQRLDRRWRKR